MNTEIKRLLLQVVPRAGEDGEYLPSLHTSEDIENFAQLIVKECASIVYKTCQDGDAGAQAILYEFDIDNARSQK